ncbi:polycystic kidney disease protein 1 2-like [Tropilaelaps mercedesae]|uniref:Polycystic kidney disease protein 1 2-like n=1 Tax=Tropilaelaps mercedesae TaxID=418985 RepID=A0A1V9XXT0_9ACAR|nr:polycystic kidney disease protein 1 2-like [Tropilaelaps mercedesae]
MNVCPFVAGTSAGSARRRQYKPPQKDDLDNVREERMRELRMSAILREIFSYLLFLWLLTVLSYGNRDPNAYWMQMNLKNEFIKNPNFMELSSTDAFYKYIRETVVPQVKVGDWYNGQQPFGLRGFINDRVNRIMGYAVMRQIRAKPNSCKVEKLMRNVVSQCRGQSSLIKEDKKHYHPKWIVMPANHSILLDPANLTNEEWRHKKAKELHGLPFWGKLDVYGGGGYIMRLRGTKENIIKRIKELEISDWIDGGTRAVFIEFSVYNAQVNLFGVVTIIAEFHPGGGVIPNYRIDAIRLMRYHQGFGLFVLLCEISFIGFIIYFTVREVKSFRALQVDYLRSYWNIAELVVLGLSYSCIFFYISRMAMTRKILKVFERSHGNAYVKLQRVAAVDEVFGYLMSFLIFISILKFTKLLRFNKRIGVLYSTLSQCSKDLSSFFVVFWVIFLAFTQVFYIVLGTKMKEFSSFITSAETCFDMARGQFKFDEISMASPVIGPLVFFVFAFITSVILLNLFVTLIISSFQSVKADIEKQCNDYEIINFMGRKVKGFFGMARGDGKITTHPVTVESQVHSLPEKVDRLLGFINEVYLDGEIVLDNKNKLKVLYKAPDRGTLQNQISAGVAQPSMFEWVEVNNSHRSMTRPKSRDPSRHESGKASGQKRRY